uniref:Reverse transcriptase domain-containing protein n=1 Tax=Tanacetum cinerariifolium TaxID=118510 RepID=A0A6L2N846_TANCI|nr:reverse transcriptase domain-containing protein [Tanacetum cinerariifolium]
MMGNLKLLCNFVKKFLGTVRFGNDRFAPILGYRDLVQGNVTINRVYYVEGLNHNLFSVGQFCDADLEVAFWKSTCFVRDLKGNDLLIDNSGSDLYTISLQESTSSTPLCLMVKASNSSMVMDQLCSSFELNKAKIISFKSKAVPSSKGRLNLLYMDLCGPMRVASINGKKHILVIVDDYSRYTWTLFLLITVQTDRDTEFLNKTLNAFFKEEGIEHQTSTARTPEQNGVVERRNPDAHVPSQQELDLLFGPMYDEFFNASSNPQDKQPTTNIQSTSAPATLIYVHAEESNDNQAEEDHLPDDEFTNPLCAPAQEVDESSLHNIGNSNVPTFNQPQVFEYRWTKHHPLEQVRRNASSPMQTRRQLAIDQILKCVCSLSPIQVFFDLSDGRKNGISQWSTEGGDADHNGCIDTRKSTSGGIQFLGDKLVSWMSKKQKCTAMSSAEAEYVALSASCAQVMWMRTQLQDYGFNYNKIPLYCDSQSAIAISCNPVHQSRTKHIHTQYHFIKEQVKNGEKDNEQYMWWFWAGKFGFRVIVSDVGMILLINPSSNLTPSTNPNPKGRNRRRSKPRIEDFNKELSPPIVTMADQRTMAQLLQAPTEGYEDEIVVPAITADNYELKHGLLTLITSTLKFLNVPNTSIKLMLFPFSLEGASRIWLEKEPPRSIFTWDDFVSKFINQFFPLSKTTNLRNEITNFQQRFDESFSEAWDRFKDLLRACPHHGFSELHQLDTFYNALNSKDQDSLNSAAGGNFLDKIPRECLAIIESKSKVCYSRNKPVVSKVSTNTSTSVPNNQNVQRNKQNRFIPNENRGNNFNQGPIYQPSVFQPPAYQGPAYQASAPQTQGVSKEDFSAYVKANDAVMRNMQTQAITTRSGVSYDGPQIPPSTSFLPKMVENEPVAIKDTVSPTNNGSTEDVQPQVVQSESPILTSEPVNSPISESVIAPVNALNPNPKSSTPYPSRRNDERNREKSNQIEKFYQIFKDTSFEISFADALILMPKFASTLKALIGNKEKLSEMARTPLNEHCSAVLLKKLPKKLGDPGKFLIPCDFLGELTLRVGKEAITFNLDQTSRYSAYYSDMTAKRIDVIDMACEEYSQDVLGNYLPEVRKELKICEAKSDKSLVDEPLEVELKDLPLHLEYTFLEGDDKLPVIIAKDLSVEEKTALITVLKSHNRMPFGLCNAPGTFQRCMIPIFHDMIKKTMEVFMYDFSVFRNSFQSCLSHLERILKRCEDTNLYLNWEKSHFMVNEGIVLGHKISKKGIEVDKGKVDVITKLPHPTTVKGIRSFLGHAGFYRCFIKDFSKIARPMTRLLEKYTPFIFSQECVEAFQTLKRKLTEAPILIALDWDMPFELTCDASDYAISAVLGQRQDKHFRPIHYAILSNHEQEHCVHGPFRLQISICKERFNGEIAPMGFAPPRIHLQSE